MLWTVIEAELVNIKNKHGKRVAYISICMAEYWKIQGDELQDLYSFRWNIKTSYYEQKTFWSLCSYMVRSCKGIEMLVNLINICYCAMKILPYQDELLKMDIAKSVTLSNWKSITIFSYAQSEIMILTL